jgi:hypothetical protein
VTAAPAPLLLALLVPPSPAAPLPSPTPSGEVLIPRGRWHHEVEVPRLAWSVLFRRTGDGDETRLLVETPAGRFVLVSTQPADGSRTREEVHIPVLAENVSRVLSHRVPAGVAECARVRPPDACVVLEGKLGRLAAPLSAFSGDGGPALLRRAKGLVSPPFAARLPGLAPALGIADLSFYSEDFLAFLDPALQRPAGPILTAPRLPGCAFDATFGHPCTADEVRREEWLFRRTPTPAPR